MRFSAFDAQRELARRAQEELAKRREHPEFKEDVIRQLTADLFPLQRKVLDDPKALLAICCGRRAGKSELAARMLAIELIRGKHNESVLFAAQTLQRSKQILWKLMERINDEYCLGWTMSEHIGQITTAEGAVCFFLGVTDANSIEKVRGSKYRLAICDETSTYEGLLERLVVDVILPGTLDFTPRGRIILTGTPGYSRAGWWYEVATGLKKGWSKYHWWMGDNPTIGDIEAKLKEMREEQEISEDDPKYKREILGLWVSDESVLVYAANEQRNSVTALPGNPTLEEIREHWLVTCALDVGFTDKCAVVALGSPPNSKQMYVLESFTKAGLRAEEQAAKLKEFRDRYKPTRTVMDIGGQGKLVHAEFTHRYGKLAGGVAIPAKKMGKVEAIGMFNSDMRTGAIKALLPAAADVYKEWDTLPWLEGSDKTKADPKFDNHCFVAGTLVTTDRGEVAIEEVTKRDHVLTRDGWRQIKNAWCSGVRETYTLVSEAGHTLTGTYDHPVWTSRGWVELGALSSKDVLLCLESKPQSSAVLCSAGTPTPRSGPNARTSECGTEIKPCICTGKSGLPYTAQSHQSITSTTKTRTQATMTQETWNVCQRQNTLRCTRLTPNGLHRVDTTCSRSLSLPQRLGTAARKAWSFTVESARCLTRIASARSMSAFGVGSSSTRKPKTPMSALVDATQPCAARLGSMMSSVCVSGAERCSKQTSTPSASVVPVRVAHVSRTGDVSAVYDLTVDETPEFYANGVLVHNCTDATLYAWREHRAFLAKPAAQPKTPEQREAEEIEAYKAAHAKRK